MVRGPIMRSVNADVASDIADEASSPDLGASASAGLARFVRCFVACTFNLLLFMLFNGPLYLAYDGTFAWSRDVSSLVDIAALLVVLAVARRRPAVIRPRACTVVACATCVVAYALCAAGATLSSAPCIVAGVCLICMPDTWELLVWMLALSTLGRRQACLCLALSGAVAVPVAYVLNQWAPYLLLNVIALASTVVVTLVCLPLTRPFFGRLATVGVPREQEITQPQAFLPLGHPFYVYLFVFSVAYGFALRCENYDGPGVSSLATLLSSVAVGVYAGRSRGVPRMDALFVASFASVAVGFMLVLMGDARVGGCASALLMAGYMCFQILVWFALCSAAARNTVDAVPTVCWGTAVGYAGICVGVLLWLVPNAFLPAALASSAGLVQGLLVVCVLAGLVLYALLTRRAFVFDAAVEGIAPDVPTPQVEVRYVDGLARRCEEAAAHFGLTAREADVMRLLAHGNTAARIHEELGIGYNTVKYHVRNVYAKMDVHSQQELIDRVAGENA